MLDTRLQVETPEGVELTLRVAGPVVRFQCWALDLAIKAALLFPGVFLQALGGVGVGIYLIYYFCLLWLYSVFFEVLFHGATPGKKMLGLQVLHDNGTPVGWQAALIRSLVAFIDFFPLCGLGLIVPLAHPAFKRLGDLAAGTVVVHTEPRSTGRRKLSAVSEAPPVTLLPEEQRALVDFAERAPRLSRGRREELAAIASALAPGDPEPLPRLLAQAAWVAGHR